MSTPSESSHGEPLSRKDQYALIEEARRSSERFKRIYFVASLSKPLAYILVILFICMPLLDWLGPIAFVVSLVFLTMLYDEIIWRAVLLPFAKNIKDAPTSAAMDDD